MAALKVHLTAAEASASHTPSNVPSGKSRSFSSPVELTVKVVGAERAGSATTSRASNKATVTAARRLIRALALPTHITRETTLLNMSCSLFLVLVVYGAEHSPRPYNVTGVSYARRRESTYPK